MSLIRKELFAKEGELDQQSLNLKRQGLVVEKRVMLGKDREFFFGKKSPLGQRSSNLKRGGLLSTVGLVRKGSFGKKQNSILKRSHH